MPWHLLSINVQMMSFLYLWLFGVLCLSVHGYFWNMVDHPDDYHVDTVYHQSQYQGLITLLWTKIHLLATHSWFSFIVVDFRKRKMLLLHSSFKFNLSGTQACCRRAMWASGRDHETHDTCYIPSGNDEHPEAMPFEVILATKIVICHKQCR